MKSNDDIKKLSVFSMAFDVYEAIYVPRMQ